MIMICYIFFECLNYYSDVYNLVNMKSTRGELVNTIRGEAVCNVSGVSYK